MSEIYEIGDVKLNLSPEALETTSPGKLRNLQVAVKKIVRDYLGDTDILPQSFLSQVKKMHPNQLSILIKGLSRPENRNTIESGFDMKGTLDWYETSGIKISELGEEECPIGIEGKNLSYISKGELGAIWNRFPETARNRALLQRVILQDILYFRSDTTSEKPTTTSEQNEALSPTSIIPSYISYAGFGTEKPNIAISLYDLPDNISENTKRIVTIEGWIHELGHAIIAPAIYGDTSYKLRFPDGNTVTGIDACLKFSNLVKGLSPISHYSSSYFSKSKISFDTGKTKTQISEEMCETIAAYFLGFAYCGNDFWSKNPFQDRPQVRKFIYDFLNAERVFE